MKQMTRISLLIVVVAAGAVLMGCGETYEQRTVLVGVPLPMTADDVVAAAKAGQGEDVIVSRLQRAGFAGALTTKDVDRLREDGVPEGAIDWMLAHPGPEALPTAPIRRTVQGVPVQEVVYVERAPQVVIVERPPPVTWTFGVGYTWGHYRHAPRYYGSHYYGSRYYGGSRYHHSPRTRVYSSGGRVYRYTSGH